MRSFFVSMILLMSSIFVYSPHGAMSVIQSNRFKEPNLYVDVTRYGVRELASTTTIPAISGITGRITAQQKSLVVSTSSCPAQMGRTCFVDGDGVVILGAGPAHSMPRPSAPKVTPSIARVGTGTLDVVTGPAGSKTNCYKIVARDKAQGLTAASPETCTTTGQTLGSNSVTLSSCSRSNATVTCMTSSAHTLAAGAMIYMSITSSGDGINWGGWFSVASSADNTHFAFNTGNDTRNGAPNATPGTFAGSVVSFNCNHLTWTPVAGTWEYFIYAGASGAETLYGIAQPVSDDLTGFGGAWDDFGATMMGNMTFPTFVPTNPPSTATSDSFITTIVSGAGTTTLTLAANASTTVSGATVLFDNAPNILTAATASGTIYFPPGGNFVTNSFLDLSGVNPTMGLPSGLWLNDTLEIGAGTKLYGEPMPFKGQQTQFDFKNKPTITVRTAYPGIYIRNNNTVAFENFFMNSNVSNGAMLMILDGGFTHSFANITYQTGTTNADTMGIALIMRGISASNASSKNHFTKLSFAGGPSQTNGATATPFFWCQTCGTTEINGLWLTRRGILFESADPGATIEIYHGYEQGGITPFLTVSHSGSAGTAGILVDTNDVILDTSSHPKVTYLPSGFPNGGGANVTFRDYGGNSPQGGPMVSGPRFVGGFPQNLFSGQNKDAVGLAGGTGYDGMFTKNGGSVPDNYSVWLAESAIATNPSYPIYVQDTAMAQPTCTVSAGGGVAIATYIFKAAPIWQNNGIGSYSVPSASCTTTSGNQTLNISWTVPAGNPKGTSLAWSTGGGYVLTATVSQCLQSQLNFSGTSTVIRSGPFNCNAAPSIGVGGPTMLMPGVQGIAAPSLTVGAVKVGNPAAVVGTLPAGSIITSGNHEMLGVACTNAELALSAGWGTNATVSAAVGRGQTCEWTITSNGTGQAANPTITDRLTNALSTECTVCEMNMVGGTGTFTMIDQTMLSATAPVFTFAGTPVAGRTYKVVRRCGP